MTGAGTVSETPYVRLGLLEIPSVGGTVVSSDPVLPHIRVPSFARVGTTYSVYVQNGRAARPGRLWFPKG